MSELRIAEKIAAHRKEKGITQEALAEYMGVSKASVSKWETGQSFPDITLLPLLAAYFDISTDELIGYAPQMSREEIRRFYCETGKEFTKQPFEVVYRKCQAEAKRYASCYPFLQKMAALYTNYIMFCKDETLRKEVFEDALSICRRIKKNCKELAVAKEAELLEAILYIFLEEPKKVLSVLGEELCPINQELQMISKAYQMLGRHEKAIEAAQAGMYQYLISMMFLIPDMMALYREDMGKIDELYNRAVELERIFSLEHLHPNAMLSIYYTAACLYMECGQDEKVPQIMKKYIDTAEYMCSRTFALHGDDFFDQIDAWLNKYTEIAPLDDAVVKKSVKAGIMGDERFRKLLDTEECKVLLRRLEAL